MRARWVIHNPSPELPIVGQTQIASFLPGKFYLISTLQLDPSSPLNKLERSLNLRVAYYDVPLGPNEFITQVFRCNKDMWIESFDNPLFERKYSTLSQAQTGHNETANLLSTGKLELSYIRRT